MSASSRSKQSKNDGEESDKENKVNHHVGEASSLTQESSQATVDSTSTQATIDEDESESSAEELTPPATQECIRDGLKCHVELIRCQVEAVKSQASQDQNKRAALKLDLDLKEFLEEQEKSGNLSESSSDTDDFKTPT